MSTRNAAIRGAAASKDNDENAASEVSLVQETKREPIPSTSKKALPFGMESPILTSLLEKLEQMANDI
jgi:hypothetical protein